MRSIQRAALLCALAVGTGTLVASCGGAGGDDEGESGPAGAAGTTSGPKAGGAGAAGASGSSGKAGGAGAPAAIAQAIPSVGAGWGICNGSFCADAARACDDFLRSGCGAPTFEVTFADPGLGKGAQDFKDAVAGCASSTLVTLGEYLAEENAVSAGKGKPVSPALARQQLDVLAAAVAGCTRTASTCASMFECFRLKLTPRPLPKEVRALAPPASTSPPPVVPPAWKKPYEGDGPDPLGPGTPWGSAAELMPSDSPSCTSCAMRRCPDFAYRCFGAGDVPADCPGGDCCHSLRRCIRDCGGYDPRTDLARFDLCALQCSVDRPGAMQQLADLQHCGDVACVGCEKLDNVVVHKGAP